jgi:hypothetical protein
MKCYVEPKLFIPVPSYQILHEANDTEAFIVNVLVVQCRVRDIFVYAARVETSPLILWPFIGLLCQPWLIDCVDCQIVSGMNEWQQKLKYSEETCPSAALSITGHTWLDQSTNSGRCDGKPATNRLSYAVAPCKEMIHCSVRQLRPTGLTMTVLTFGKDVYWLDRNLMTVAFRTKLELVTVCFACAAWVEKSCTYRSRS